MSTFQGLEIAKKALFTQQSAIYTTGHNIANANTEGYSRQRVNFEADVAFPPAARNRPAAPGQIGAGVKAGSIERIRNEFLDIQYRGQNTLNGYWEKRAQSLGRMESMMNELNETGLNAMMDHFWNGLQDLSVDPMSQGARAVVKERGIAFADAFNYYDQTLSRIRTDLKREMEITVQNVNTIIEQVDSLNTQIQSLEIHGYLTNDLYDRRDHLIDQLSNIIDIDVSYSKSGDGAKSMAEGLVTLTTNDGVTLVDGVNGGFHEVSVVPSIESADFDYVSAIKIGEEVISMPPKKQGVLYSLIETYGYRTSDDDPVQGDFIEMQADLKNMAEVFVAEFNEVHQSGTSLNDGVATPAFFIIEEGVLRVNEAIIDDPGLIAASGDGTLGDGSNAIKLAAVFDEVLHFGGPGEEPATVRDHYSSIFGSMAIQVEEAERMSQNMNVLVSQVQNQRQSVSAVSLDEEMTNLMKFQHAYNAAARSMTAVDEMLDRIINNMGLVGR